MSYSSDSIAFSDLTFLSKVLVLLSWLIKSAVLFIIFFALVILKEKMIRNGMPLSEIALNMAFVVVFYSVVFLLFYIISEHIIKNMIGGIILSILGAALAVVFPPLGILLAVIGILSIISKIISVIKMIPLLLLGVLFAVLLFADLLIAEFKFNEFYPFVRSVISISAFGFQFIFSKIMLAI